MNKCFYTTCENQGLYRCSICKIALYCSADHQKLHWKQHKISCKCNTTIDTKDKPRQVDNIECSESKKICRCMFCGEELVLKSEDEAVMHMTVCPALQEQLASKDQFTVPSMLKGKMNMDKSN